MLKIGHRGASGYELENTLPSFRKAIELKVDMIELDVRKCKTGEIIVFHNKRINNFTKSVSEMSLKEIRKIKLKNNEKIPTLKESLDLINARVKVNIELKDEVGKEVLKIIESYVKKNWAYNHFVVSSFNHKELILLHNLNPKIKIGLIIPEVKEMCLHKSFRGFFLISFLFRKISFSKLLRLFNQMNNNPKMKIYSINSPIENINKSFVEQAHNKKIKVFVWTLNSKRQIEKAKEMGVDGIISDFPDRIA